MCADRWDTNPLIDPYWEAATQLGVPIFVTPGHGPQVAQAQAFGNMYPQSATSGAVSQNEVRCAAPVSRQPHAPLPSCRLPRHTRAAVPTAQKRKQQPPAG
eukprot:SAG22_NODE_59_length_23617_cov_252.868144_5_plen_101_part_00